MSSPAPVPQEIDLVQAVRDAWTAELRKDRFSGKPATRTYVYASGIKSCTREMALDLTHPEDHPPFDDQSLARMRRGTERESAIVNWLMRIGQRCDPPFRVIEGQRRFEIKDRDGTLLVVGKVDCRLAFETPLIADKPFVEIKSGEGIRRIETFEDFDRSPWTRHMPDQLLSYLYAENQPWGMFVLDRPGLPQFVKVPLLDNLARVERVLGQVRRAVDVQAIDAPLPPFTEDRGNCKRCPHLKKSCTPPMDFGPGVPILTDPVLIEAAETRERTREAHEEYEAADKHVKEALRGTEMALFGDFQAIGKWGKNTTYKFPEELKAQYRHVEEKGKFTLKIERITP